MSRTLAILLALAPAALVLAGDAAVSRDPLAVDLQAALCAPSAAHPLGCDALGRDLLARLAAGTKLSLAIAGAVVLLAGAFGTFVGFAAALGGPRIDALMMRATDIVLAFPGLLLAMGLAAALGPGPDRLVLALAATGWCGFARLARAQALSLLASPMLEAARALGCPLWRIGLVHLLPNAAAPLIVEASFGLAAAVLGEAGLSFLGLGTPPPAPSLGGMIREGTAYLLVHPVLAFWPGLVLFGLVLAANLFGDALRDRLDVRVRDV